MGKGGRCGEDYWSEVEECARWVYEDGGVSEVGERYWEDLAYSWYLEVL